MIESGINEGAAGVADGSGSVIVADLKGRTKRQEHREWNPFNSYKLLAQVERWRKIKRGKPIPPPVLIIVDSTSVCNLRYVWCNAEFVHRKLWGSEEHWKIHDRIVVKNECPRCTYQPHNEIYERVILNDSMTHKFI